MGHLQTQTSMTRKDCHYITLELKCQDYRTKKIFKASKENKWQRQIHENYIRPLSRKPKNPGKLGMMCFKSQE
jgi:hypothetical protein